MKAPPAVVALSVVALTCACTSTPPHPTPGPSRDGSVPAGYVAAEVIADPLGGTPRLLGAAAGPPDLSQLSVTWILAERPSPSDRRFEIFFADSGSARCGIADAVHIEERDAFVAVQVTQTAPDSTSPGVPECDGGAVPASASVSLAAPLGDRALIEPA